MSQRSLTVSTDGSGDPTPGAEGWSVNPAISLHADDDLRSRLIPINRRYSIAELEKAAIDYASATGRRVRSSGP